MTGWFRGREVHRFQRPAVQCGERRRHKEHCKSAVIRARENTASIQPACPSDGVRTIAVAVSAADVKQVVYPVATTVSAPGTPAAAHTGLVTNDAPAPVMPKLVMNAPVTKP